MGGLIFYAENSLKCALSCESTIASNTTSTTQNSWLTGVGLRLMCAPNVYVEAYGL